MYEELVLSIANLAVVKENLLKKGLTKYLVLSLFAGLYVGLGIILIFTIGGVVGDSPYRKVLMGVSFGIALSLVLVAGSELFTGNNLIMTVGSLEKKVSWMTTLKIWVYSYIGNLAGSILAAWLFFMAGLGQGPVGDFILKTTVIKMNAPFMELFFKGVLCNILVCLAVLSYIKLKEETAKLIMVFWCLFAFITSGFEHSIANMTLLSIGLMMPHSEAVSLLGFMNNLIPVTLGNIVGGAVVLGFGYWYVGHDKSK
jgi:nitrite transporter NirC